VPQIAPHVVATQEHWAGNIFQVEKKPIKKAAQAAFLFTAEVTKSALMILAGGL